jgi:filamentous hemagglutinin family protein
MKKKTAPSIQFARLVAAALVSTQLALTPVHALPSTAATNLTPSTGVTLNQTGSVLTVTAPDKAVLNWTHFGGGGQAIAAGETVAFFLPNSSASVLNRVNGGSTTTIDGTISSNGNVYILNPSGIIIGPSGVINTASLVLSTVDESAGYFSQFGSLSYVGNSSGPGVSVNGGSITAVGTSGHITLASHAVAINQGQLSGNTYIRTSGGQASLGATGPVAIKSSGVPKSGSLSVVTNGGNVILSGSTTGTVTVQGDLIVNTTGNTNGSITQGSQTITANGVGTTASMNAGVGASAGNITLNSAGGVDFLTLSASGNTVSVKDVAGGIALSATKATGNLTVSSASDITSASPSTVGGNVSLSAAPTGKIVFTSVGNVTVSSLGSSASADISSDGNIVLSNPVNTGSLLLTSTSGSLAASNLTLSGASTLSAKQDVTLSNPVTAGVLTVTSTDGSIVANTSITLSDAASFTSKQDLTLGSLSQSAKQLSLSAGRNLTGANLSLTGTGDSTIASVGDNLWSGTISGGAASGGVTLSSQGGAVRYAGLNWTSTNPVALASAADIAIGATTAPVFSAASSAGKITQTGVITSSNKATFTAKSDITLTLNNALTQAVLINTDNSPVSLTNSGVLTLGNLTSTNGLTAITSAGDINLGATSSDALHFGGALSLTTTGGAVIRTLANKMAVFGDVTLTTNNTNATLGVQGSNFLANYTFGAIKGNLGTGALAVVENTTLNLGNITAGSVTAASINGDIVNSGAIVTPSLTVAAGQYIAPTDITLTNSANAIGSVAVSNAKNFTLVNTGNTSVTAGSLTVPGQSVTGTTKVTVQGAGNTLSIGRVGNGNLNVVSFTAPGAVTVSDIDGITLQSLTSSGSGAFTANVTGPIVLGSGIALGSSGITTLNSTGAKASITDSAPGVSVFGPLVLSSDNSIALTQAGHSAGPVSLLTTGANGASGTANVQYVEAGSANLNQVSLNTSGNVATPAATLSVTSSAGDVIQTTATGSIVVPKPAGVSNVATFSAPNGRVALTNPAGTNNLAVPVVLTSLGNSSISQGQAIDLGNVSVSAGTLTVDTSSAAGKAITELSGATIQVYGDSTFNTQGGAISLARTGNGFGGITAVTTLGGAAAGADVTITESGTIKFVSVAAGTAGKLAAVSENDAIIQSQDSLTGLTAGGTATFSAPSGISLTSASSNNVLSGGVAFTTSGDVTLRDSSSVTILNDSNIGGKATFRNTVTNGQLRSGTGSLRVYGATSFDVDSNSGTINIGNGGNRFGAVSFRGKTVTITESTTLNLSAGSLALGPTALSSAGDIITSGNGGSTFGSTLNLVALGDITISAVNVVLGSGGSGLTFRSGGSTNLGSLSLLGNLNGIAPSNLGAVKYMPPST